MQVLGPRRVLVLPRVLGPHRFWDPHRVLGPHWVLGPTFPICQGKLWFRPKHEKYSQDFRENYRVQTI